MGVIRTDGIICTSRSHAEHGAVVKLFTSGYGLMTGYVRGAKSRTKRPILMPGNIVSAEFRNRNTGQMGGLDVELIESRAPYYDEPLSAAAFEWATILTSRALPEENPYPQLFQAFSALLNAISSAPSARGWSVAMVRYELLLLKEMGFGLDLKRCVVSGSSEDLKYVSPKSGGAVSVSSASGREHLLLRLPGFLTRDASPDWTDIFHGMALTGHFVARQFFDVNRSNALSSRMILTDRLKRAVA